MAEIGTQRRNLLAFILTLATSVAFAVDVPSAGSQLQQVRPPPTLPNSAPNLRIDTTAAQDTATSDTKLLVKALTIQNAHAFSEASLIAATQFKAGEELTLSGLRRIAAQIANYYHEHGYFLAQATLPPQDVRDGVVTIAVMEGRYGSVVLKNQSKLNGGVVNRLLADLHGGDAVEMRALESRLLLLSDLPGVEVKSTLTPGSSVGAADLIVEVNAGKSWSGDLEADNFGSRYTGAYRLGGLVNANNPFGLADVASLRILSSFDGFDYGRAAYQLQIDRATLGISYTALHYELGEELEALQAHGTAKIISLFGRYPLLRTRQSNLNLVANLDSKQFDDELDVTSPAIITKKTTHAAMMSLVGDRKDRTGLGGILNYSATLTVGSLNLRDAQAVNSGAINSLEEGGYTKLGVSTSYLKAISSSLNFYASLQGQWAADNLDVSEKLGLGGVSGVRAYPEGEAYVDEGVVLNVEARMPFGRWQAVGFADIGTGSLSVKPSAGPTNRRTLSGIGLGLHWSLDRNFFVRASYAHKLGSATATSVPDSDGRFWVNAVKYF